MRTLAILTLLLGAAAAGGGKAPDMDERSRELLEAWEKKEYNLGRAGAEKASFKFSAHVQGAVNGQTGASYVWDGEKGTLRFDDAAIGESLSREGWNDRTFDSWFRGHPFTHGAKGKLVAEDREDGTAVVKVVDDPEAEVAELHFDTEGVLVAMVSKGRAGGVTIPVKVTLRYRKESGLYLASGWTAEVRTPGGRYVEETKLEYRKVGVFHVVARAESTATMGGRPAGSKRILFSDWEFNEDVGK